MAQKLTDTENYSKKARQDFSLVTRLSIDRQLVKKKQVKITYYYAITPKTDKPVSLSPLAVKEKKLH